MHALGCAIDINPAQNPMSRTLITDMPREFIQCFKDAGFSWGGDYPNRKDAMHFELINLEVIKKHMSLQEDVDNLKEEVKTFKADQVRKHELIEEGIKKEKKINKKQKNKIAKLFSRKKGKTYINGKIKKVKDYVDNKIK